jgi:putative heme transporter
VALPGEPRTPAVVRLVDLDLRTILVAVGAFVALVALTGLVRSTPRTLAALAVGLILALALDPVVAQVERAARVRRSVAVPAVLVSFAALVGLALLVLVPPAIRQANDLGDELPAVVAEMGDVPLVGDRLIENDVPARVQSWIEELPSRLAGDTAPIQRAGRTVADGLLAATATFLLAVTLLLDGERLLLGARRLVPPARRAQADRVGRLLHNVVGRYVAGSLMVAGVAGLATLVAGLVLGVPLTPLVAIWVAMWNLVPQIGGAVGGIPFVLLGLTQGPTTGLACAAFFIVYLQIENHLLQPLLVGQAVKLSPPATMTAALIGVSAAGVVGAMVAVPLVGAAKAVYHDLRPPPPDPDG